MYKRILPLRDGETEPQCEARLRLSRGWYEIPQKDIDTLLETADGAMSLLSYLNDQNRNSLKILDAISNNPKVMENLKMISVKIKKSKSTLNCSSKP